MPHQGFDEQPTDRIRVVTINFTFDNAELIIMLKERGEFIKAEEWEKVKKIE